MAAVAIAAAAIGGGTATLVQQLAADGTTTASASAPVAGTNVAARGTGTVAGVAEAVSPPSWRSPPPRTPASPPARA